MESLTGRQLSRRAVIRAGGSLGLTALLAACAAPTPTATPVPAAKPAEKPADKPATAAPAAPTNTPAAGAAATKPAAPAVAAPVSKEAVKIVWAPQTGDHANWQKSRYPLFQQQNPGVAIEFMEIPGADYRAKIFSMAATKTLPDMVFFANDTTRLFHKRGTIRPIDDLVKSDNLDLAPFWPALLRDLKVKEQLVGIPNNGNIGANIYYYNADLLKASGVAEPEPKSWTTGDLLEIARKVTKKGQVWGFQPFTKSTFFFGHFTRMFGSRVDEVAVRPRARPRGDPEPDRAARADDRQLRRRQDRDLPPVCRSGLDADAAEAGLRLEGARRAARSRQ
jgi:ABC-type glycerol-3-phosphate transport system substrate-binding protein